MEGKRAFLGKLFSTVFTAKRILPSMSEHVGGKIALEPKGLVANIADKRFLASVRTKMLCEVTFLCKGFATDLAQKWFFTRMAAHVVREPVVVSVLFAANVTFELFVSAVVFYPYEVPL